MTCPRSQPGWWPTNPESSWRCGGFPSCLSPRRNVRSLTLSFFAWALIDMVGLASTAFLVFSKNFSVSFLFFGAPRGFLSALPWLKHDTLCSWDVQGDDNHCQTGASQSRIFWFFDIFSGINGPIFVVLFCFDNNKNVNLLGWSCFHFETVQNVEIFISVFTTVGRPGMILICHD